MRPKCHPFWIENGERVDNQNMTSLAYTATGYVMPCCWMDPVNAKGDEPNPLHVEELKLSNNTSVKQVMLSPIWLKFHRDLIESPECALKICREMCGE